MGDGTGDGSEVDLCIQGELARVHMEHLQVRWGGRLSSSTEAWEVSIGR